MSELSYKELQEQGIFDVPYRAFEYMQSQQAKIDSLNKNIEALHVEIERIQKEYQGMFEGVQGRQKTIDELKAKYDELNNRATCIALDQMTTAKLNYELQKRIDDITQKLNNIKNDTLRSHRYDYDNGWRDCAITTLNDLKGNTNDH